MSKLQIISLVLSAIVLAIVGLALFWTKHSVRGVYRLIRLRLHKFMKRTRYQATRSTNTVPAE